MEYMVMEDITLSDLLCVLFAASILAAAIVTMIDVWRDGE